MNSVIERNKALQALALVKSRESEGKVKVERIDSKTFKIIKL